MTTFTNDTEKIEFLRKYKLLSETSTDLSGFYYYKPESDIPVSCDVIGCENAFETWAAVTIRTDNEIFTIHSDYLLDMKKRGRSFHKIPVPRASRQARNSTSAPYVVLDLETTGLNYKQDEIIEIAAIKYSGEEVLTFNEMVRPKSAIPANITKLTGITDEMVQNADSIENVLPKFLDFIGACRLIGHNIKTFDILFINKACQDLGLSPIKNNITDTLPLARKTLRGLANYKLSTVCAHYGIDSLGAHRALEDCRMCHECYVRMSSR